MTTMYNNFKFSNEEQKEKFKKIAKLKYMSVRSLITLLVDEYIKKYEQPK